MIRVGLLDTTVRGLPGSMARYRDQLCSALTSYCGDEVEVFTEYLGCDQRTLDRTPARLRMWRRHYHAWWAAKRLDSRRYDLLHLLDGSFGYLAEALPASKLVVTVHDVIPRLQMEGAFEEAPPVGRGARWLIGRCLRGIRSSSVVCSDSQSTADDLRRFHCEPDGGIEVVPLAIEPELFEQLPTASGNLGLQGPFLFHLGNNGFYKNRAATIEVFRRIEPGLDVRLVLAGPRPDDQILAQRRASGRADRINFVIDPDQETLKQLYAAASVFLFPSRYEGFGWPPLEAMASGCPVVSSDGGSLPEVVGDAGVILPTGAHDEMARVCERLIVDESFRREKIQKGFARIEQFSSRKLAESMAHVYKKVVQDQNRHD